MTDPTDARSKAEASHRLAELAKSPRARELFRQLAAEYEGKALAGFSEPVEAAPPLAPAAPVAQAAPLAPAAPSSDSERWLAGLKQIREDT